MQLCSRCPSSPSALSRFARPLWLASLALLLSPLLFVSPAQAAPTASGTGGLRRPPGPPHKPFQWLNSLQTANIQQQKTGKLILLYFSGTGWDDFTSELDEQVLNTDAFTNWAEQAVIPLRVDFPDAKGAVKQNAWLKNQNDALKIKYAISKVPTFLFVDEAGDVLARVGYDTARLRKEEQDGHPNTWLAFCEQVVKSVPPPQPLLQQRNLTEAVAYSRKHAIPLLLLITQGVSGTNLQEKDGIKSHPAFIKFVNRNMVFLDLKWPDETDTTPAAQQIRDFGKQWKFGPASLEIVVWSPAGLGEFKDQITTLSVQNIQPLLKRLDGDLPKIDYNGGWIDDYKLAQAICHQQKKDMFISFVQSDDNSWSKQWNEEVYQTPEFKKYAKENLVLLKVDFPKSTTQPAGLAEQNKNLAEMFGVRGYPTMVILNPLGQKIGDAKFMKGGSKAFLAALEKLRREDHDRRTLPSEEAAKGS